jgi:Domain of unknown function (DUF4826)
MERSDPSGEEEWCKARAQEVAQCVHRLQLEHGRLGTWPAWHVAPYASIWAVERKDRPEWVGWWVVAGELPTDAIPAHDLPTPRDALRAFGKRWVLHGASLDRGEVPIQWAHLPDSALPKLTAQLKSRGQALQVWADDESAWPREAD